MPLYTQDEMAKFRRPHVTRCWFGEFFLPSGTVRLHPGVGTVWAGGHEWKGVSDPIGGQLVSIGQVEDPRFGQAAAVAIVISGANPAFVKMIDEDAAAIEGSSVNLYWCCFDGETGEQIIPLRSAFPGLLSSPAIEWDGPDRVTVAFTVESIWVSMNEPYGGEWSATGVAIMNPGDRGGEYIGVKVEERLQ